jgi:hypothetical protein
MGSTAGGGRTEIAMVGQVYDTGQLHPNGQTLHLTGWLHFDPTDELDATINVTVTQTVTEGNPPVTATVTATGTLVDWPKNKRFWAVEADAQGGGQFRPGLAFVTVNAMVTETSSPPDEPYPGQNDPPWDRWVTLVA